MVKCSKRIQTFILLITLSITFPLYALTPSDTLVMGYRMDDLINLDPAETFEFSGLELIANLYQRLIRTSPQSPDTFLPDAAKEWHISPDNLVYTFTIKSNQYFPSGRPLTAFDAAFSLKRTVALQRAPGTILEGLGWTPENLTEMIQAPNEHTLRLKVPHPFSSHFVMNCLASMGASILEQKTFEHALQAGAGLNWSKKQSFGSGPYQLQSWHPNHSISLKKNSNTTAEVKINKIFIKNIKESATQQLLFKKRDLDIARNLTAEQLNNLPAQTLLTPKAWLIYLGLNTQETHLKNPLVQDALRYLIDYQAIAQNLYHNQGVVYQNIIPKPLIGSTADTPLHYNLTKAQQLLKQAGLERGFELTIDTMQTDMAAALQASFAKANIKLKILSSDSKQILTKYRARNHQLFLGTWGADYLDPHNCMTFVANSDDSQHSLHKTIAWRNHWHNEQQALWDEALLIEDLAERTHTYQTLAKAVASHGPIIVLLQKQEMVALQNSIQGYVSGPLAAHTLYAGIQK